MGTSNVLLGFVGDLFVNRDTPTDAFRHVRTVLSAPGILFGNLESAYTDDPRPVPSAIGVLSAPAINLDVYAEVGFDVVSMANNHIVDAGYEAMLETRARLRAQGIRTCGAGDCLAEAHEPAIIESNGIRVAFLAYASTFPMGYEARSDRPGLAPMRAYNFWREPVPNIHEPGMYPLVTTVPDQTDLACLTEDLRRARERADLVVASFHWGDYNRPFRLTDHEKRTARYCIDSGADMVVGHHHHSLRGMEWYKGKPIMYGLGHFVFDRRLDMTEEQYRKWLLELDPAGTLEDVPYRMGPRAGWPFLPMHEDTRMTCVAWASAQGNVISDIGFLPCRLTPDGSVHPLDLDTAESDEVIAYVDRCNRTQGLMSRIVAGNSPALAGFGTVRVVADRS